MHHSGHSGFNRPLAKRPYATVGTDRPTRIVRKSFQSPTRETPLCNCMQCSSTVHQRCIIVSIAHSRNAPMQLYRNTLWQLITLASDTWVSIAHSRNAPIQRTLLHSARRFQSPTRETPLYNYAHRADMKVSIAHSRNAPIQHMHSVAIVWSMPEHGFNRPLAKRPYTTQQCQRSNQWTLHGFNRPLAKRPYATTKLFIHRMQVIRVFQSPTRETPLYNLSAQMLHDGVS